MNQEIADTLDGVNQVKIRADDTLTLIAGLLEIAQVEGDIASEDQSLQLIQSALESLGLGSLVELLPSGEGSSNGEMLSPIIGEQVTLAKTNIDTHVAELQSGIDTQVATAQTDIASQTANSKLDINATATQVKADLKQNVTAMVKQAIQDEQLFILKVVEDAMNRRGY